jgi:c-di-GMP-binding flagellar brake protein YcgR
MDSRRFESEEPEPETTGVPRERRVHPRLRCKGVGEFRLLPNGPSITGTLINLSLGGCCIASATEIPAKLKQPLEVQLTACDFRLLLSAEVRRLDEKTVGVKFVDVSSRKEEQIRYLIDELFELGKIRFLGRDR